MNVTQEQIKNHPRIKRLGVGIARVRNNQPASSPTRSQVKAAREQSITRNAQGSGLAGKGLQIPDRNIAPRSRTAASRLIVSAGSHGLTRAAAALADHVKTDYPRKPDPTSVSIYRASSVRQALVERLQEERAHDTPILRTGIIESSLHHKPDALITTEDGFRIDATFYLSEVHLSATAPAGSPIGWFAMSPILMPHSLLRRLANMFEQYRFDYVKIEYVPMCPATTSATIAGAVTTDVYENPSYLNSGNDLIRAMVARPGFDIVQAFSKAVFELKYPQQVWYHTSAIEEPALCVPGAFTLVSAGSGPADGSPPTPLGILIAHVGCSFRSMRLGTLTNDLTVGTDAANPTVFSLSIPPSAHSQWSTFGGLPAVFSDLSTDMRAENLIVACHIVKVIDPTAVSQGTVTDWRTVTSIDGRSVLLADNFLFMRYYQGYFYFYANLGEAISGAGDPQALLFPNAWTSTAGNAYMQFNRAHTLDLSTSN